MKKIIFMVITAFLFTNNVSAQDIEQQLNNMKNNLSSLKEDVKNLNEDRLNKTYPVGSIYITTAYSSASEVKEALGGQWEVYKSGKTLVGVDENNSNFNTVDKTGGSSTSVLSTTNLPQHYHSIPSLTGTATLAGEHSHTILFGNNSPVSITYIAGTVQTLNITSWERVNMVNSGSFKTTSMGAHTHSVTTVADTSGNIGSATPFTNLQPYITVYMYKRVA